MMNNMNLDGVSLILEGGTYRGVHTAGILDHFLEEEIMVPYILGISAGAVNVVSYISKQKERTKRIFINYRHDKRYIGKRNFLKERSLFGLDFAYNIVPNELDLFDWTTYYNYDGIVKFGVTNAKTGQVEYKNALEMDKEFTLLRATCAIPVVFPEIKLDNVAYYDGGLSEPVPIQKAIDDGFDKHIIILTRPKGYRKTTDSQSKFAMKILQKKYPKLAEAMAHRAEHYNQAMELCERLEREGKAFIYRPLQPLKSFEKDVKQLEVNYMAGLQQAQSRHQELERFLEKQM